MYVYCYLVMIRLSIILDLHKVVITQVANPSTHVHCKVIYSYTRIYGKDVLSCLFCYVHICFHCSVNKQSKEYFCVQEYVKMYHSFAYYAYKIVINIFKIWKFLISLKHKMHIFCVYRCFIYFFHKM